MRLSSAFIFLVATISCDPVAVTSAANVFGAEAVGGEIDYLEATSDFVEADVVVGGIDDVEATSYPVETGADGGAYGVSDASVEAVADIFADSLRISTASVVMGPNMLHKQIICG